MIIKNYFMESKNKELTEVLNTLIKINIDRTEGYEKALVECKENFPDLQLLFFEFADQSRGNISVLKNKVLDFGAEAASHSTLSGKIYSVWTDIKWAFTGVDREGILESCAVAEEAARPVRRSSGGMMKAWVHCSAEEGTCGRCGKSDGILICRRSPRARGQYDRRSRRSRTGRLARQAIDLGCMAAVLALPCDLCDAIRLQDRHVRDHGELLDKLDAGRVEQDVVPELRPSGSRGDGVSLQVEARTYK